MNLLAIPLGFAVGCLLCLLTTEVRKWFWHLKLSRLDASIAKNWAAFTDCRQEVAAQKGCLIAHDGELTVVPMQIAG